MKLKWITGGDLKPQNSKNENSYFKTLLDKEEKWIVTPLRWREITHPACNGNSEMIKILRKSPQKKARSHERCHGISVSKGLLTRAKKTLEKQCSWHFPNSVRLLSLQKLQLITKQVLATIQVEKSGCQAGGLLTLSHSEGCFFINAQKPLFLDCGFLLGFIFAEDINFGALISCQLTWGDRKIFYLSSYV